MRHIVVIDERNCRTRSNVELGWVKALLRISTVVVSLGAGGVVLSSAGVVLSAGVRLSVGVVLSAGVVVVSAGTTAG